MKMHNSLLNKHSSIAVTDQATPETLLHAHVTREGGDADIQQLTPSHFDAVSTAERNAGAHAIRDQIIAGVTSRHGDAKLEIRLDPPELGRVTIGFEKDGADMVRAVISADTPETLDLMRRHADIFQRALEDQGFEGLDLHFADRGPQENPTDEGQKQVFSFGFEENEDQLTTGAAQAEQVALGRLDRRL